MLLLAIDTSTTVRVAVARAADGSAGDAGDAGDAAWAPRVLARRVEVDARRHVELLVPAVAGVLEAAQVDRRDLTHVVVGTGPAPFTGLRVGVATAQVLAEALGIAVGGVSSLDAVAATAADEAARAGAPLHGELVAATDAKRREVHWARYAVDAAGEPRLLDGPHVGPPGAVPPVRVVGPGAALCRRDGDGADARALAVDGLDPGVLAVLAARRIAASTPLGPAVPCYLRRPDARPLADPAP